MKPKDVPKGEMTVMIQCKICDCWYHTCVGLTEDEVKRFKRIGELWMCDYRGCHDSFGDIFDSD